MGASLPRETNGNWRGGQHLSSSGYVKVLVGPCHHLSDSKGYAYEHRVVAEQKIGRRLRPCEQVHHLDGDKTNNDPSNLVICTGRGHRVYHRASESSLRLPGERNPLIRCSCGCGQQFRKYDRYGRKRVFVSGHNLHGMGA